MRNIGKNISIKQLLLLSLFGVLLFFLLLFGETFLGIMVMAAVVVFIFLSSYKNGDLFWESKGQFSAAIILWLGFFLIALISTYYSHSIPLTIGFWWFYALMFVMFVWATVTIKTISLAKNGSFTNTFLDQVSYSDKSSFFITPTQTSVVIILVALAVSIMGMVFLVIPGGTGLLPGMNILVATYGHSHLASVMLLVCPVSWFFALFLYKEAQLLSKRKKRLAQLTIVVPLFFSFVLLTSFGRIGTLIGLFQLLAVWIISKKYIFNYQLPKGIQRILVFIFSLFALVIASQIVLSIVSEAGSACFLPVYKHQLCKPIRNESRPEYWNQAVKAVQEFPVLGYGPGTFSILSARYLSEDGFKTSYAHNAFLQVFSEIGLLGGLMFIAILGWLYWNATKHFRWQDVFLYKVSKNYSLNYHQLLSYFLIISVTSSLFNAFFDFDWSFSGLFLITILFLVTTIKVNHFYLKEATKKTEGKPSQTKYIIERIKKIDQTFIYLKKGTFVFAGTFIVVMAFLFCMTEFLIYKQKYSAAAQFFPYNPFHRKLFLLEKNLPLNEKVSVFQIYRHHPDAYVEFLLDKNAKLTLNDLRRYEVLTPLDFRYMEDHVVLLKESSEWVELLDQLEKNYEKLEQFRTKNGYEYNYWLRRRFATEAALVAGEVFKLGDMKSSAKAMVLAQKLYEWELSQHTTVWMDRGFESEIKMAEFVYNLEALDVSKVARDDEYVDLFFQYIESDLGVNKIGVVEKILTLQDWQWYKLGDVIYSNYVDSLSLVTSQDRPELLGSDIGEREKLLRSSEELFWFYLELARLQDRTVNTEKFGKIATLLVQRANTQVTDEKQEAVHTLQKALKLDEWVLLDASIWWEQNSIETATDIQLKMITETFQELRPSQLGHKADGFEKVYMELVARNLATGKSEEAKKYFDHYLTISGNKDLISQHADYVSSRLISLSKPSSNEYSLNCDDRFFVAFEKLQFLDQDLRLSAWDHSEAVRMIVEDLEQSVKAKDWVCSERVLATTTKLFSDDYGLALLPGYYYVWRAETSQNIIEQQDLLKTAQTSFIQCNQEWLSQHDECKVIAEDFSVKAQRIWEVISVIKGEAKWDEFSN